VLMYQGIAMVQFNAINDDAAIDAKTTITQHPNRADTHTSHTSAHPRSPQTSFTSTPPYPTYARIKAVRATMAIASTDTDVAAEAPLPGLLLGG